MTPITDILRAIHLVVEGVVQAEDEASDEYARKLYDDLLNERMLRVYRMIEERRASRHG